MPTNGLVLPGGLGINTNPCTATQMSNNLGAIANALNNLQGQLGDTTNLNTATPGNPDGTVAGAIGDLQGQITGGGGGGGGFPAGYGGLQIENSNDISIAYASIGGNFLLEFDNNFTNLNTVLTNTSGSKIQVANAGVYLAIANATVGFSGSSNIPDSLSSSIWITLNGSSSPSSITPIIIGNQNLQVIGVGGAALHTQMQVTACGLVSLSALDYLQVRYGFGGTSSNWTFVDPTPTVSVNSMGSDFVFQWQKGSFVIARIA